MKYFYTLLSFILFLYACTNTANRQVQKTTTKDFKPGFGELMAAIQTHHEKLWFAGQYANWKLAKFEIHEIKENFEQIEKFQTERVESNEIKMVYPYLENILKDITSADKDSFNQDYLILTRNCNTCHNSTGYDFIKIKKPDKNHFSNQIFKINN